MFRKEATVLILVSIFIAGIALGEAQGSSSEEIKVIAHYKEEIKERIFASGDVEIHYKNVKLFADRIELNQNSKDVYAEGNVVIQTPETVMSGEWVRFNLDTSKAEMKNVFGKIQPTFFFEAKSLERKDESVYNLRKARFTTCSQPVPRWVFSCSKGKIKWNDYVEMWNSVFSVKKIPILYFPYIRYALHKKRTTGFLIPLMGQSSQKGFSLSQSFFWAIKRNMDATFNLDYYAAGGLGRGLEFRYLFSNGTAGELNLYYFTFKKKPDQEAQPPGYIIRLNHNQRLPLNFSLVADIDLQSSYDFLREFDNDINRAVVSTRHSQVYLSRAWSYYNLSMRFSKFETYFPEIENGTIRKTLPEINFSSSTIKLFSPLFFSFSSSFIRWEDGWQPAYQEGRQKRSQSLSFTPVLTIPFTKIPWLTMTSSFLNNFNYYFQSYAENSQEVVPEPLFTHNYILNAEFVGPVFFKIYRDAEGTARLKHIIEPSFTYRYESPTAFSERIISPWIFTRNHYIRYGLTNRFLIKKDDIPKEICVLGLRQIFYFSPEESPLQVYRIDGEIPQFSNVDCYLRFYPAAKHSVDISGVFNPYYKTFSSLRLGANLGSPEDSLFLRVDWYKSINPFVEDVLGNRHQISCFGNVKIPLLSLEAQARVDFNIQERKMLYSGFRLLYHYQCLEFRFDLDMFYFREKPDIQFKISLKLMNIGSTVNFLGGMKF